MGVIETIRGKRVYLDTNIFIYIFEDSPEHQALVNSLLELIISNEVNCVTNEITLGELLVQPYRQKNGDVVQQYIEALNDKEFVCLTPATQSTHIKAAQIRAEFGMKYPDALHMAAALLSECDAFLTNDTGIKPVDGIELVQI